MSLLLTTKRKKVFLGGTCNDSTWRDELIPMLTKVDYFNPVVEDWTPACQEEEIKQRVNCDFVLYIITPQMTGVYSIAEAIESAIIRPKNTIFCVLNKYDGKEFDKFQIQSLLATGRLINSYGSPVFQDLKQVAAYLNSK